MCSSKLLLPAAERDSLGFIRLSDAGSATWLGLGIGVKDVDGAGRFQVGPAYTKRRGAPDDKGHKRSGIKTRGRTHYALSKVRQPRGFKHIITGRKRN